MLLSLALAPEVVAASRTGDSGMDETEFLGFYRDTAPRLHAFLCRCLGDAARAEDLVQESYLRLLRSGLEAQGPQHRERYLFRIGANLARDHFRSPRRREVALDERAPEPRAPVAEDAGEGADIRGALAELSPRDRAMLWLAYVEGRDHAEIGAILGLRTASLKSMLSRARARLAAALRARGYCPVGEERR
ncbi:MAG: RNA polymerase sigma factor [Acidobacteria bacterium]|nr:RNA polymerase sigma factor [Acidobacteriota bacterium]